MPDWSVVVKDGILVLIVSIFSFKYMVVVVELVCECPLVFVMISALKHWFVDLLAVDRVLFGSAWSWLVILFFHFNFLWFLRRAEFVCEDLLDGGSQLKGRVEQDKGGQHLKYFVNFFASKIWNNLGHNFSKYGVEENPSFNAPVLSESVGDVVNLQKLSKNIFFHNPFCVQKWEHLSDFGQDTYEIYANIACYAICYCRVCTSLLHLIKCSPRWWRWWGRWGGRRAWPRWCSGLPLVAWSIAIATCLPIWTI